MPVVLQMGISWEYDNHLLLSSSKEIAKILQCWEFFVWTPLLSEACELTQSHSINGSPGLDRLPDRLRRQWRYLVQTFLKWYRDDLLCLVCTSVQTNSKPQCYIIGSSVTVCRVCKKNKLFISTICLSRNFSCHF